MKTSPETRCDRQRPHSPERHWESGASPARSSAARIVSSAAARNGLHRRSRPDGQREGLVQRREGKSRVGGNGGLFPEHLPADPPPGDLQRGQFRIEETVHLGGAAEEEGFPRGIARVVADAGGGQKTGRAAPLFIRFAADEGDPDPLRQSRRQIAELRLEGDVVGAAGPVEKGDPRVESPRCDLPEHRPDRA